MRAARAQVALHSGDEVTVRVKSGQYSFIAVLAEAEAGAPSHSQEAELAGTASADVGAAAAAAAAARVAAAVLDDEAAPAEPCSRAAATGVPCALHGCAMRAQ